MIDKETGEIITGARPITDTIRRIGGGMYLDSASDLLAELVSAVDQSGKPGKLDLSILVKKATRGGAMIITGKLRLTKPAEEPMECMLFATPDGNLETDDPKQHRLDLKSVITAVEVDHANLKTV